MERHKLKVIENVAGQVIVKRIVKLKPLNVLATMTEAAEQE